MSTTPRRLSKYELQELLGRGGMAEVWKAFDTQLQRYVAIKLLHANLQADPDFVSRFTREAQTIAALRHPTIVQIYDFHCSGSAGGSNSDSDAIAYMVMEYIKGQTLAHYIYNTSSKHQFPSPAVIVRLFTSISLAVDYAHQHGMIHRDIKPANILLDQTHTSRNSMGEPILSDFGLAKVMAAASQTVTGALLGTPLYISPEQVQNRPVSNQTDIYALGVVLYEMFTGTPPFQGDSLTGVMMQHLTETPKPPHLVNPSLPPALSQVLLKSLAKNPSERFSSASALTAAVAQAFHLPVPEDLKEVIANDTDLSGEETILASSLPAGTSSSSEATIRATAVPDATIASSAEAATVSSDPYTPITMTPAEAVSNQVNLPDSETGLNPHLQTPIETARQNAANQQPLVSAPPAGTAPPVVSPPPAPASQKRPIPRIALTALLIVIIVGGGLGTFFLLNHNGSTIPGAASTIVGQAFFMSSGKINETTNEGSNDEFQINLHNIPAPQAGKSYYAWLLPDKSNVEGAPLLLGKPTVNNGAINFTYTGDSQHTNLLATMSQFLITEESSSVPPNVPSPDQNTWRYYAALPQTPASGQKYSLLDHLRHLLASDPDLEPYHLPGGLAVWTNRNTQKIQQWAGNAMSDWNKKDYASMRHQLVAILDYLDSSQFVQQDLPSGTQQAVVVNQTIAHVGLLQLKANQQPPGYLYHIALHLNGVLSSPGSNQYQRNLAVQINTGINNVTRWLGQERQDAVQLLQMSDTQLASQSTQDKLNDLVTQANNTFTGQTDPTTHQQQIGVSQIYKQIQLLATLDVTPYKQG